MLLELESAIIDRLEPLKSTHNFRLGALDAQELNRAVMESHVFVAFAGDRFGAEITLNRFRERITTFEIAVRIKDLRKHSEAYPVLEAILDRLTGWKPAEAIRGLEPQRLTPPPQDLIREAGIWLYVLSFEVYTPFYGAN